MKAIKLKKKGATHICIAVLHFEHSQLKQCCCEREKWLITGRKTFEKGQKATTADSMYMWQRDWLSNTAKEAKFPTVSS